MSDIISTMNDVRRILLEQLADLKAGKIQPTAANAMCNTTGKLFYSIKLEFEYARLTGQTPFIPFIQLESPQPPKELTGATV